VLPETLVGSRGLREVFGGVHSSRAVNFGSRRKSWVLLFSWQAGGAKVLASHMLWDSCVQHQPLEAELQHGALEAHISVPLCRAKRLQVLSCGLMRGARHMGEFPFSAFQWLVTGRFFRQHDFERNTA